MSVLVDSDILIEVSRGRDTAIMARWQALSQSDETILYSHVTCAEVWAGAFPREFNTLSRLFSTLLCAPADAETGLIAGEYLRLYRKSHSLELADALVAAAATQSKATLWTRNRKHYPMKPISFY